MANVPQAVEPAIPARPPRISLETSATIVTGANERWEDGIAWQPEQCAGGFRVAADYCDDVDAQAAATPALAESSPFVVGAGETCSTFGWNSRDWEGRARRQLVATRSAQIAAELWTGSLNGAGLALTDATSDTLTAQGAPVDPVPALGLIEAGLAHYLQGRPGMVHVSPQVLTALVAAYGVRLEGNVYTSPMGHIVVADAGYPGTGPADDTASAASQWIYGTAMVALRLGQVSIVPGSLADARARAAAVDRSINSITVTANQIVVIQLDPCAHVAAEVNIAPPAIGGAS